MCCQTAGWYIPVGTQDRVAAARERMRLTPPNNLCWRRPKPIGRRLHRVVDTAGLEGAVGGKFSCVGKRSKGSTRVIVKDTCTYKDRTLLVLLFLGGCDRHGRPKSGNPSGTTFYLHPSNADTTTKTWLRAHVGQGGDAAREVQPGR